MAVQDTSLNPKILNNARKEFMKKGFLNASLKNICDNAGVTTGAIYKRYKGKEELFEAVVQPALDLLDKIFSEYGKEYENMNKEQYRKIMDSSLEHNQKFIQLLYPEKKTFKILFGRAEGTKYSNFLYELAEKRAKENIDFMQKMKKKGFAEVNITLKEFRILSISYWLTFAEIFVQDFTLEEALSFAEKFDKFFNWQVLMKLTK